MRAVEGGALVVPPTGCPVTGGTGYGSALILGFSSFASRSTGAYPAGLPGTYDLNILSTLTGQSWADPTQTNAQRLASMKHSRRLVWTGSQVTAQVPDVLSPGTPLMTVNSPAVIAGAYAVGAAAFGPPLAAPGITGSLVQALDPADGAGPTTFDACSAITNAAAVAGNIALVDRGTCGFIVKVKNAQNAGAIAVVGVANFVSFLENTESYRRDLRRVEYGDERDPAMRAFLTRISPVSNADKIRAPLLVVHGKNDPRVPYTEAEQIVAAARKSGVPVWYLLADNEGHGFARKANADFLFYSMIAFLERTLLGR